MDHGLISLEKTPTSVVNSLKLKLGLLRGTLGMLFAGNAKQLCFSVCLRETQLR